MYIFVAASERRVAGRAGGEVAAADGAIAEVVADPVAGTLMPTTEAVAAWDVAR